MQLSAALVALAATSVSAVKPLKIQGNEFYDPDSGNKFQIVGMAYQPGGSSGYNAEKLQDPLSDPETCMRDAALMQAIGINTVRSYNLNPNANHDACASIFNAAGIYMIIDVNAPQMSLDAAKPWESYYNAYLNRTFAVVEAFKGYNNTLAFFSANEAIDSTNHTEFTPGYIRAVTRDLRQYIKKHSDRDIPVGYSAADIRDVLPETYHYLECDNGKNDMSEGEIFALNSYSWCGPKASFTNSGYQNITNTLKDTHVPVFFSEYGCNEDPPRLWDETKSLYGDDMDKIFSGGIIYQWTEDANHYGIVNITGDKLTLMDDYTRIKSKFGELNWKDIQGQKAAKKDIKAPKCDAKMIKYPGFEKNFTLPVIDGTDKLISDGVNPKPSGKFISIDNYNVKMSVFDAQGNAIKNLKVVPQKDNQFNVYGNVQLDTGKTSDGKTSGDSKGGKNSTDNAAGLVHPAVWAAAMPALAMLAF